MWRANRTLAKVRRLGRALHAVAAMSLFAAGSVSADVLLDETNLVAIPSVAAPSQHSFTATSAQALTLTLTDFQNPAAFTSLQIAVTLGNTLVGSATVDAATHTATLAIPAAAGTYTLRVIGTPDATQGWGSFGVCVAAASTCNTSNQIAAYSFSDSLVTPATPSPSGTSTLQTSFTSTAAGTYTVTITDDAFPLPLSSLSGGISQGSTPIASLAAGATPVTLAAKTSYTLIMGAVADATATAGLYAIRITDPAGAPVFERTLPVGTMAPSTIVQNSAAQSLNLSLTDVGYPAALASLGAAVTEGSSLRAKLSAAGTLSGFQAPAGSLEIWQYAVAGAQPGVYSLNLSAGTSSLFSTTQVAASAATGSTLSYAFVVTLPTAGTYNLLINDFQFPGLLPPLTATVAQNGVALTRSAAGDFTAAQGLIVVVVETQAPASGSGIFGVTVQTSGASPQILLDQTQAVGAVFTSQTINLGTSGGYTATLADLGFPANFQDLDAVVSRGSQVLGKIYGAGAFPFPGTPGQYVVTLLTTPGPENYGLYSIEVANSVPTVTFTASASSVMAGDTVTLTWSSTDASTCTAGGGTGWTGSQAVSGSLALVVSATETLTLTCTGPGGSSPVKSVTVTATPAASSGGGGGGSLDGALLAALAMLTLARVRASALVRRRARSCA